MTQNVHAFKAVISANFISSKLLLLIVVFIGMLLPTSAQNVVATWALTGGKTVAVTGTSASSVTAQSLTLGSALTDAGNNSSGQKLSISSGNWPSAVSSVNYVDVSIAPVAGFDLSITSVSADFAVTGGSGQLAASFQDSIKGNTGFSAITTSNTASLPTSSGSATTYPFTTTLSVLNTNTINVRIYFYYSGSAVTSSRSVYVKNVVLKGNATTVVMPVTISKFNATPQNGSVHVNWNVANEVNMSKYVIEKSTDAVHFSEVGVVAASGLGAYSWLDATVANSNLYRIKAIDKTGSLQYTTIVSVAMGLYKESLSIAPNPVVNKQLNVLLSMQQSGTYNLSLYNMIGQKVYTTTITHNGGGSAQTIQLPASLNKGMYAVQIDGNNVKMNKSIIIE